MTRPRPVPAMMIGSAVAPAVAGTKRTSTRPSAIEPATKIGRPRMAGLPASGPVGAGAATGGASAAVGASVVDMLVALSPDGTERQDSRSLFAHARKGRSAGGAPHRPHLRGALRLEGGGPGQRRRPGGQPEGARGAAGELRIGGGDLRQLERRRQHLVTRDRLPGQAELRGAPAVE